MLQLIAHAGVLTCESIHEQAIKVALSDSLRWKVENTPQVFHTSRARARVHAYAASLVPARGSIRFDRAINSPPSLGAPPVGIAADDGVLGADMAMETDVLDGLYGRPERCAERWERPDDVE